MLQRGAVAGIGARRRGRGRAGRGCEAAARGICAWSGRRGRGFGVVFFFFFFVDGYLRKSVSSKLGKLFCKSKYNYYQKKKNLQHTLCLPLQIG